ncbi:hypothetical protein IGD39_004648 [Salmonella enterica]|uniref:Uncharacterized protein n=4 Tax=Salmonella enterica TaxID=28901 RepID=A0A3X9FQN1_SALET|nr:MULTISPECIES: hypothetical protein [unclassified Tatumella]EAA5383980.1 hypothetical protein [Salmonella enterica subsp. enterica]EAB2690776.1 hypothetical protein [Salmonella enterica]EBV0930631.1 hypothetical protein [Salmonella enterica subsp. enterica serovar Newport]EBV7077305.1 hypothetical protein [Salmonella enterica subsp. enterica serovar Java]ECA3954746.1 hypothetical protein [Salmonella enterica subsp. enterica serovar Enteritidis]EDD5452385.1 hypothetical protein [Salmonella e
MIKTHELISFADYIIKIMSYYPGKSVDFALDDILSLLEEKKSNEKINVVRTQLSPFITQKNNSLKDDSNIFDSRINDFANDIENRTPEEIESILNNVEVFKNVGAIKLFAKILGIKTAGRQNRLTLIKMIVKTIERSRIDKTIGNRSS